MEGLKENHRRDRDPGVTRKAILEAAEKLFSERGFAGTSVRDISDVSGVSQPLIHHHFGSKRALYQDVKKKAIEKFWELWSRRVSLYENNEIDPGKLLVEGIEAFFWFIKDNEHLVRLSFWACLEGDTDLWPGEKESVEFFAEEIKRAQEAGIVSNDVNPYMFTIMLEAVTIFWWQYRSNLAKLFLDDDKKISEAFMDTLDQKYLNNVLKIFGGRS